MNRTVMLAGHLDVSATLVRPPLTTATQSQFDVWFSFLLPFAKPLWGYLFALVLASGVVDWLVEFEYGGRLTVSLYEYCGGVLWYGNSEYT